MAIHFSEDIDDSQEMHDINVTPFIDVMLVLLIIFMVAAPLSTVDVRVNLPASSAKAQSRPDKPVYLTVKADKQVTTEQLASQLEQVTQGNKDTTIFFRADKTTDYATIMSVMDSLRQAGYLKVGLVGAEQASSAGH
jgi:biopolymer transport protein ExbD